LIYLLDTDHLSLLERGNTESLPLQKRLATVPADAVATTIVTYEEQMRGWLERAASANTPERLEFSYARLLLHIQTFQNIPLFPFDQVAIAIFEQLKAQKLGVIGTMDLKIAAITIASNATLLTRNTKDFGKIPNLRYDDWSY
jgi:tRNA(fMet)-specific endonuclease VapC